MVTVVAPVLFGDTSAQVKFVLLKESVNGLQLFGSKLALSTIIVVNVALLVIGDNVILIGLVLHFATGAVTSGQSSTC